jgi:serine/threonine protein kinase
MSDEQQIHNDLAGMVGTVLAGTYRLDALIGEGGMGAVFRGRHVLLRRDVAIKVLHPDFSRDPSSSNASTARPRAPPASTTPTASRSPSSARPTRA